ncbi:methyltransferase [Sinomonas sp. JGH33]|uniref:Methyltransferase n=1 Tax=Sinomonas terricola TaxID=3110330 RepID=A0ABU5T2A8_9MICC|nr:methyltransferase [Sinomonas sp. JGH33]MEA5453789.1 methyltransferase [Sinomonas sp. JGH33]
MGSETAVDVPSSSELPLLRRLAADLAAVGYTVDNVAELLGPAAHAALSRDQIVPALVATERAMRLTAEAGAPREVAASGGVHEADDDDGAVRRAALAAVVRLFLLGRDVPESAVAAALPAIGPSGLAELGLAEAVPGCPGSEPAPLRALVDLRPYEWIDAEGAEMDRGEVRMWVASDLAAHQRPGILRKDHVLGIGHASTTLVQSTARRRVGTALDLGTGCGIQTFHLLRHADRVVATDVSERALGFTRFNLLLNAAQLGLDPEHPGERVDLRLGSLFEPVAGERFDFVVSNPPFVITPREEGETAEDQFTYRDGGLPGDQLVAGLVASLGDVLAEGGTAQLLGNWEVRAGEEWHERVRSWVPTGLDAWVLQRELVSPEQYAETWLRDASEQRDPDAYATSYAAYLDDFASRGTEGIGFGMMWFRRPAPGQARLDRFESLTHPIEQPIGPHWQAAVERADWLGSIGPSGFAQVHLVVADDVTEERHQRPGAEHPGVILVRQGAGFRRTALLSTEQAGFISACDGELAAGQIAAALGALLGRDDEGFAQHLLEEIRELTEDGFLMKA